MLIVHNQITSLFINERKLRIEAANPFNLVEIKIMEQSLFMDGKMFCS